MSALKVGDRVKLPGTYEVLKVDTSDNTVYINLGADWCSWVPSEDLEVIRPTTLDQLRRQPLGVPLRIATYPYAYIRLAGGMLMCVDQHDYSKVIALKHETQGGWDRCTHEVTPVPEAAQ